MVDLSRKGSVDDAIVPMVELLNSMEEYYTTSSCSGRISVFSEDSKQQKKGCHWLLTSHDSIGLPQLLSAVGTDLPDSGYVYFKFEPFVLHVMCRTLQDAQTLLQTAVGCGFRNSGITYGKKGKLLLAVRSTQALQAPVAFGGSLIVSKEYLKHLVEIGNTKLQENLHRVNRFSQQLKEILPGRDQKQSSGSTLSGSRFKESVRTHQSRGDRDSTTKPHQSAMDSTTNPHQSAMDSTTKPHQSAMDSTTKPHQLAMDSTTMPHQSAMDSTTMPHQSAMDSTTMPHQSAMDSTTMPHQSAMDSTTKPHQSAMDSSNEDEVLLTELFAIPL